MRFWRRRYGAAYRLKLMALDVCVFSDPEAIRTIFSAKGDEMWAGETNRILRALVGERSVLLLDGREHSRHRKLLMPQFHGDRMRFYGQTMAAITRQVCASFEPNKTYEIHAATQEITLQIILRTVFGADEGAEMRELHGQIKRMLAVAESKLAFPLLVFLAQRPELESHPLVRPLMNNRNLTDEMLYAIIQKRRIDPQAAERTDVLAMLMQARDEAGQPLSDKELRDELMTALAAGHETTATALAWAFERILQHPHVYERLRAELQAAGGFEAAPDELSALPYLDATIKEVMRQRPVLPLVARMLKKDASIGGYQLKAGTAVGACIYLAQHNPEVYPEPQRFKPERFLGKQPDPASWLPFGGGIRRCIGAQFATYEMKIVLATMLNHYEFQLAQKTPVRTVRRAITLFPQHGIQVTCTPVAQTPSKPTPISTRACHCNEQLAHEE